MNEQRIVFSEPHNLIGTITEPDSGSNDRCPPCVILLNAGMVHRVGPARLYVRLARMLAESGAIVLRFDHSGIGDSGVRKDNIPYEQSAAAEVREAMDVMARRHCCRQFVLMGICSGAVTAFKVAGTDDRVAGIVMMNAQGYETSRQWNMYIMNRDWSKQYWQRSLFSRDSWKRALTGRIQYRRLLTVIGRQIKNRILPGKEVGSVADRLAKQMQNLIQRDIRTLLVYSEGDRGLDYLHVILGNQSDTLLNSRTITQKVVPDSDHTFTLLANQHCLCRIVSNWFRQTYLNKDRSIEKIVEHSDAACLAGMPGRL